MRMFHLFPVSLALLTGCQATGPIKNSPSPAIAAAQQLPSVAASPASLETPPLVQPVHYVQPVAESLTQATLKPITAGVPSLSLNDLEQMALGANPSLARAASLVQAARGNWVQVGLPPNPSVGYEGQQIGSRGLAEQDGVFVAQEIVRGGKLKLNRQMAAQEWARAEQDLVAQRQRVLTDVRASFYQVLVAQRQEQVTEDLLDVAREGLKVVDKLQRGKEVGRVDLVQAQLEAENAEILAQNARNRRTAAWQGLVVVIGNPTLSPQPLEGDLEEVREELRWEESLQRLLAGSPELSAATANVERARWAVQRAMVEKTPNVTVQGLVNWRDNGVGGRSDGAVSVGVPLPLWNRNQGGVTQAQHEAAAAERALQQLELALQRRLAPVYERYANAQQQTTRYRTKILPAAQESLKLTRQLYEVGEIGYINLLTAQRTFSQTNLTYLESLRELRSAEVEIEGLLLSGSLESR